MAREKILNNINVGKLTKMVDRIKKRPETAKFRLRAFNKLVEGTHCKTMIKDFYGAGKEDSSRRSAFRLHADEPEVLLGENHGPNATEAALYALASCLNTTFMYHASARGVKVEDLELELEGELDLRGILGIDERVRNGFEHITVNFKVKADASDEEIKELCELAQRRSPVFDMMTHGVPVCVKLQVEKEKVRA